MEDSELARLSEGGKGHSLLVFALRQQRYGDVTADLLQLVGALDGRADRAENNPQPPPVLQLGAKLSERKTSARTRPRLEGPIGLIKTRTDLYFHHSVGHIQVPQTGGRARPSLLTKTGSISRYGDGL